MKELNRRAFLTLSGAAVVALSLAGCSGEPSAPPAPPASESKELALFNAINEVWYEVNREVSHTTKEGYLSENLLYCQEAADLAKYVASPFEKYEPEIDENDGDFRLWYLDRGEYLEYKNNVGFMMEAINEKYCSPSSCFDPAGVNISSNSGMQLEQQYPRSPSEVRKFVKYLAGPKGCVELEPAEWLIGLYCPTIKGKTYTVAVLVRHWLR